MQAGLQRVQLTRSLELWQRKQGHRTGTDDVLCAWAGATACPDAERVLDMGAGQGAVGLMIAGTLSAAHVTAVEAQAVSFELLERNVAVNQLSERFQLVHADLREFDPQEGAFDLITGTPPFMPLGSGTPPRDAQREAARFEIRGGIEAYCDAASRLLAEQGTLVIVMDAARPERYRNAFGAAGLHLKRTMAVLPKPALPPAYLIYWATRTEVSAAPRLEHIAVRTPSGDWSDAFRALRRQLDLPR